MKLSCTTLACPNWTMDTILSRFKQYGFDAVDFRGLMNEMSLWTMPQFTTELAATQKQIAASGLPVSAFSSSAQLYRDKPEAIAASLDEVRQYVRLCRAFKAPIIRVFGGAFKKTSTPENAVNVAYDTLTKMAALAAPDVKIGVETHDDWCRSELLAEVMRRVKAPNVGIIWDVCNPFQAEKEAPEQTYRTLARWIIGTHFKDAKPGPDGKDVYVLPGEGGMIPIAACVQLLKAGGYTGYLTVEWEKKWHPEIAEPDVSLPAWSKCLRELAG